MTTTSPAMDAALQQRIVMVFGALEIALPSHTIRVLDSSGVLKFGDGRVFSGKDNTYGTIFKVQTLSDGTGDQAPALKFTFTPTSDAAAADLASAAMQGSIVTMWLGVADPGLGVVVGEALTLFVGLLDVPVIKNGAKGRFVEITASSHMDDFFLSNDGVRLNDTWHQHVWPGETGLSFVNGVTFQVYWGTDTPAGVTRSY